MQLLSVSPRSNRHLLLANLAFLALFVISNVTPLPSVVTAIFALFWILFIPFEIGKFFVRLPLKIIKSLSYALSTLGVEGVFVTWAIGFLLIIAIALTLIFLGVSSAIIGSSFLLISIIGELVPGKRASQFRINQNILRALVISIVLGISFSAYIRSFSPYPLTPGMDVFTHLYVIKSINHNAVANSPLLYAPSFDTIIALGTSTFHADPLEIFWLGIFVLSSLFAISLYTLTYWTTKNHIVATLSVIIGLLVTEQGLVSNLQFFFPSSVVMSVFPAYFFVIYKVVKQNSLVILQKFVLLILPFSVLILIHFELGIMAPLMISLYFATSYIAKRFRIVLPIIRLATISLAAILLLYYNGYITSQVQLTLYDGQYSFNTPVKIKILNEWYTHEIITISLLGLIAVSFLGKRSVLVGFVASIILLIYFQKIDWIHRIMTLERPLLAFTAAAILAFPILILSKSVLPKFNMLMQQLREKSLFRGHFRVKSELSHGLSYPTLISRTSIVYSMLVIFVIFPTLLQPYSLYIQQYTSRNNDFVNFTSEELMAAKWIEHNTPSDYRIYSDPFTVIEMRGLAYRHEIEGIGWNGTVANMVKSALSASNPAEAYQSAISYKGEKIVIVIDSRTSEWLKGTNYYVQFPVKTFTAFPGFNNFLDTKYFTLAYQSQNVYVFLPNKQVSATT